MKSVSLAFEFDRATQLEPLHVQRRALITCCLGQFNQVLVVAVAQRLRIQAQVDVERSHMRRLGVGLGVSFGRNSALRTCFGLDRLPKHGIYASLPARTIGPERCQDVWIDPKCNGFLRWKFVLSSNLAKLCDSGNRTAAMGDDPLLPVNSCWRHRWPCGRKRGSNLVLAKEARSSL